MPNITNRYGLPEAMVTALTPERRRPEKHRIGVTTLIDAPYRRILTMAHFDEIEDEVSDGLWALLGKSAHSVLERSGAGVTEEKIEYAHSSGMLITGIPDSYSNGVITDWKVTSVFSFLLGDKVEWERQLNVYAYLYLMLGRQVSGLQIYAILRDHQRNKTREEGYPPIPFLCKEVPLWDSLDAEMYVDTRCNLHKDAENGVSLEPCSPEERWTRPNTFAVVKKIGERAYRVKDSLAEAEQCIIDSSLRGYIVEERKGADVRCDSYCSVSKWCSYYNRIGV